MWLTMQLATLRHLYDNIIILRIGISKPILDELSILHLYRLPALHRDPFDRMLACQTIEHGLTILTLDHLMTQYPVRTLW
jgi:PIN domain nuclease of toxin-antitoxin system